jgi:ribosome maturation factor RimP
MSLNSKLSQLFHEVLSQYPDMFLIEEKHNQNFHEFILDGDAPIGIAQIASVSRQLNKRAEEQIPAEENYSIDVATPGADSALKNIRQYAKHIGRNFQLKLEDDTEITAKLLNVDGNDLTFQYFENPKPKKTELPIERVIPFNQIKQANIILSFK